MLVSPEERAYRSVEARPFSFLRHRRVLLALSLWLLLLGGYGLYAWRTGLSPTEAAHGLLHFMATGAGSAPGRSSRRRPSSRAASRPPNISNSEKARRRTMIRRETRSRPCWTTAAPEVVVDLYRVAG